LNLGRASPPDTQVKIDQNICTQGSFLFAASILIMRINAEEWHNKA
jgi:hypothetical protein